MSKTRLAILGSAGSIGRQTLNVVDAHRDLFDVIALCTHSNSDLLAAQCQSFRPKYAALTGNKAAHEYELFGAKLLTGSESSRLLASLDDVDIVVIASNGMQAIDPLLAAIRSKKRIAIANKESIVCGGEFVQREIAKYNAQIYPIDSELSAIFQCMQGVSKNEISNIVLTASGGPFRDWSTQQMQQATIEQALCHPNWSMGKKITVDSASMVNKGREIMEAHFFFAVEPENIHVLIHPSSLVHSMVRMKDGALLAQLACTDMRQAIQYALTYPKRLACPAPELSLEELTDLTFFRPDYARFPALKLAYDALRLGGTAPVVYNAAAEEATELFLASRIGFLDMAEIIDAALCAVSPVAAHSLDAIIQADDTTRKFVRKRYNQ